MKKRNKKQPDTDGEFAQTKRPCPCTGLTLAWTILQKVKSVEAMIEIIAREVKRQADNSG